ARTGAHRLHRQAAGAAGAGDDGFCFVHDQGRDAVGGRGGVAQVAAETRPVLDHDGPDERASGAQGGVMLLHLGQGRDLGARHGRPDGEPILRIPAELTQFRDALDVHHEARPPPAFLELGDEVGAAGEHAGRAVGTGQELYGLGYRPRGGVGKGFHPGRRLLECANNNSPALVFLAGAWGSSPARLGGRPGDASVLAMFSVVLLVAVWLAFRAVERMARLFVTLWDVGCSTGSTPGCATGTL